MGGISVFGVRHGVFWQTIAEFVESEEILRRITELGIDYAQGYYVGKPAPELVL
ncbi:MAG: EAL domain-containing protein [Aquificaceae bacterium]|nr:EAL domain-containing protein [Aquificaceae bacterium]MCS7308134.1 EAL domain-containing protein [Aquificaceae bacterium]MCX8076567.1 EAL domain-containing protein [Aquificaceae bacterium]